MVCPILCPPIILGGSIISKYFGLSDLIFGIWCGALITLLFLITLRWMNKKGIKFLFRKPLLFFGFFILVYYPLYYFKFIIYMPYFFILDKFLLGNIFGILTILLSEKFNNYLMKKNKQKVYFKFQKVLIPLVLLLFLSLIVYFLEKILL